MSRLNRFFLRSEFACRCGCGANTVDAELLDLLTRVREHFGKPVVINSGFRCPDHNRAVGGKPSSYHLRGQAADIVIPDVDSEEVVKYVAGLSQTRYGIGWYPGFTHLDVRRDRTHWVGE